MTQNEISAAERPKEATGKQGTGASEFDESRAPAHCLASPEAGVKRLSFERCDVANHLGHEDAEKLTNPLLVAAATPPQRGLSRANCYVPPFDLDSTVSSSAERCPLKDELLSAHGKSVSSHTPRPFVIGVCGGTASGKTTVCDLFEKHLKDERVAFIPSDCFYKCLTPEQKQKVVDNDYDFDHPDSIDWEGVKDCVKRLRQFGGTSLPQYDFKTHSRTSQRVEVPPADVIIVEGILIFASDKELRDMIDLKIFVDCDADVRLARRLSRDIADRGRELSSVLVQYMKFVKPSYETFVDPSKRHADIIIPNLGNQMNMVGVELLIQQIRHQLDARRHLSLETRRKEIDELDKELENKQKELNAEGEKEEKKNGI